LQSEQPNANVNEWIDEQAGMLMKFGSPILQISRIGAENASFCARLLCQNDHFTNPGSGQI
jgi:hypothetical protein